MWRGLISLSITIAATHPAWAGSMVYTSLPSWQASAPGSTAVLDFESVSVAYYGSFSSNPYSFNPSSGGLYVLPGAAAGTGSGRYLTTDGASVLNISLAAGVYGAAFNLGSNSGSPATASILATDINGAQYLTSNFTTSGPAGPAMFWSLRNDVQLVSIRITFTPAIQPQLDNIRYSNTALPPQGPVVPEPAPWSLVAIGGILLLVRRRPIARSPRSSFRLRGLAPEPHSTVSLPGKCLAQAAPERSIG